MSYNELIALIDACVNRNGVHAITGRIMNGVLKAMVNQLGAGFVLGGVAHPADDPGTPEAPVCYFASEEGTYTHFGGLTIAAGEFALFCYDLTDGWYKETIYEGITEITASIDDQVGTPEVYVEYQNGVLSFDFRNMKGNTGDPAGFGNISADVDANIGTPAVTVSSSGPDTAKVLAFHFKNLKGETGVTSVVATVDNTSGNPTCAVSLNGQELHLDFTGLKGAQGDTGVSADYPIAIVNNLTTNDPTSALSAAMGVQLESEVSQLEQEVNGKAAVNLTGVIPVVYNTTNQKSSGAKCTIDIPAGTYLFHIDSSYLGDSAQLYVTINGTGTSLGTLSAINDKNVTLSGDATEFYIWANAANSLQTGDCAFSFSQEGIDGLSQNIAALEVSAKKIDGASNSTEVQIALTTTAQTAAGTRTDCDIKAGKYWVDVPTMSVLTLSNVFVYAYYKSAPTTNVLIGYLSTFMENYWVLNGNTYLHEIEFAEDVVAISVYHAINATNAGTLKLSFVDQNPVLSMDAEFQRVNKKNCPAFNAFTNSGTVAANGGVLNLPQVHITKNSAFSAEIEGTITSVSFGVGYDATTANKRGYTGYWCELDATTLAVYYSDNNTQLVKSYTHGLTLDDRTKVSIRVMDNIGTRIIRIVTKAGQEFATTDNPTFFGVGKAFVENNNTSGDVTAKVSFLPCDITKKVWVFGDSYCGMYNPARWMNQLVRMGVGNFLLNAKGGAAMKEGVEDLANTLSIGAIPTYIVWALGMNGAADTNASTVSDYQKLWLMRFLRICKQNGITPVICTIPTVPSLQHNAYDAYVKTLGYRIIDLADAVGAQSDGTWYSGLLSGDGVHPSEEGAKVLAQRVILDFPEIQELTN